jgi:hypothetical protein
MRGVQLRNNSSLKFLGLVLSTLTTGSIAWGLPLVQILVPTPGAVIPEGGGPAIIDFRVMNNDPVNTLILDYAFASITPGPPDVDDFAHFSGTNGNAGLVSGSLTIGPGAIGHYTYSFSSPADPNDPNPAENLDFGLNRVFFAIEMSVLANNCTGPPVNTISSATPLVVWVDQTGCPNPADGVALTSVLNLQNPQLNAPPHNKLYADGIIGTDAAGNPFGLSTVQVNDTPDPSTLVLLGSGLLGVACLRRRMFKQR